MSTDLIIISDMAGIEPAILCCLYSDSELSRLETSFAHISDELDQFISRLNNTNNSK